jgi:ligand-binding sensor domain-containing protein/two-component sensor histidine kinase
MTRTLGVVALLAIWSVPLFSPAQEQRLSQYAHRAWLVRDGFFNGNPRTITQTTDGYIWIGAGSSLYRFDGSRLEPWSSPDGRKLPSNVILNLLGAHDGSLWIGMIGGLAHFVNGKLTLYPDFHADVGALLEDRSGKIWFTAADPAGALRTPLCEAFAKTIHCLGESDGMTTKACCSLHLGQDTEGYLWVATEGPLFRWKPGHSETYLPKEWTQIEGIQTATSIIGMPDGSVLVCVPRPGAFGGLQRLADGRWNPVKVPGFDGSKVEALRAFRDSDGGIWLGTADEGVYRIHGNEFTRCNSQDGLSGDDVRGFYEDREHGIWVATMGGVDYFHSRKVATFSKREGLASDQTDGVTAAANNAVWLNSGNTLDLLRNGHVEAIRTSPGSPGPTAIFEDSFGRLWCGIDNDLYRYDHGKFQRVNGKSGGSTHLIVGITEDSAHDIWAEVSGGSHELIHIHGLQVVEEYPEAVIPSARALAAGPNGVLWLGLRNGDLARFQNGHATVFPSPGGPKSYVYQVVVNPDGTLFATTSAGLIDWRNGKSHLLSSKNGLPCDLVIGAAWDNLNSLWLDTGCGLVRISKADIERWWRDDTAVVTPKVLDALDGAGAGGSPNFNPMVRTADGRLWIADGLVKEIDPAHLAQNDLLPPVQIEDVIADHKPYRLGRGVALPPLTRDLEIDYAALSFVNPQKVRFRYKLEARDTAWQEAGARRQAFYTDLPPGSYRFRVIASNNDGVWNDQGAAFAFVISPAWYQTLWSYLFFTSLAVILCYVLYLVRLRQYAASIRMRFDERLGERTRIARELHDTLLQSFHGLMFQFQAARNLLPQKTEPAMQALDEAILATEQALAEGRDAIRDLRLEAATQHDLAELLNAAGQELSGVHAANAHPPTFRVIVEGKPHRLAPTLHEEIYRIGREVIRNAFHHAAASHIEVEIRYDEGQLRLRIRDDGKGIDPKFLEAGGSPGHWGLPGIRERAQRIGSQLEFWSEAGAGTEVELRVPAAIAYEKTPDTHRFRWFHTRGSNGKHT